MEINTDEVAEPNSFAICATKGSFNQSEDWINELNQHIQNNKDYAISFIQKENQRCLCSAHRSNFIFYGSIAIRYV